MSTPKSAASLIPSDPSKVSVIRDITPNITTFSTPFLRFGLVKVGGRGTLVKLKTGSLAIFSPTALTPEVKQKVDSLGGKLKYIIANDYEHHIFVTPWAKAYPDADVIGVEGLPEKREKDPDTAGIKFSQVFTAKNKLEVELAPEFRDEFDVEYFDAHANKELVVNHKPSRTLIQADLIWNLPAIEQFSKTDIDPRSGFFTQLFGAFFSLRGDYTWQKRFWWYAAAGKNRPGFKDSLDRIAKWDYDRIIPAHGEVIETGGKKVVEQLGDWFTSGKYKL
ncbi:hypothetical protein DV735_g2462, partial [Chaetothyriales sp. CBS 134920]